MPDDGDNERLIPRPREIARDFFVLLVVLAVGFGLTAVFGALSTSLGTGMAIVVIAVLVLLVMR